MDCNIFKELITQYLLSPEDIDNHLLSEFEEHFLVCADCWDLLETQKAVLGVLEDEQDTIFDEVEAEELIQKAELAEENKDYEEAAKLLKQALEIRPDDESIKSRIHNIESRLIVKNLPKEDLGDLLESAGDFHKELMEDLLKKDELHEDELIKKERMLLEREKALIEKERQSIQAKIDKLGIKTTMISYVDDGSGKESPPKSPEHEINTKVNINGISTKHFIDGDKLCLVLMQKEISEILLVEGYVDEVAFFQENIPISLFIKHKNQLVAQSNIRQPQESLTFSNEPSKKPKGSFLLMLEGPKYSIYMNHKGETRIEIPMQTSSV